MKTVCGIKLDNIVCLIEPQQIVILENGNTLDLTYSYFLKVKEEYNRYEAIKEAFQYVFEKRVDIRNYNTSFEVSCKDFWCKVWDNGEFAFSTNESFTGQLTDFNFDSTWKAAWIRYAQDIKDAYLNNIVDVVKVAKEVLKSRGLDKEWAIDRDKYQPYFFIQKGAYKLYYKEDDKLTYVEWYRLINSDLDRYYSKLENQPKLTVKDIIECLEEVSSCPVSGISRESLESLRITYNKFIIEWIITKEAVSVHCEDKEHFYLKSYTKPTTLEEWNDLFKDSFNRAKVFFDIANQVKQKEPSLIDLLKKAFPSYQWLKYNNHIEGKNSLLILRVYTEYFDNKEIISKGMFVYESKDNFIMKVSGATFNTENLTNYTNWEQWLEDLIKAKQNLAELEQSPNLKRDESFKHLTEKQYKKCIDALFGGEDLEVVDPWED